MLKAFTALAVLFACPAVAGGCGPVEEFQRILREQYGEEPGPAKRCGAGGELVCEEWSNPRTGTWTWVVYPGDGRMCSLMDGVPVGEPA